MGGWNICQKWEVSNQNGRVGNSGISQRMTLACCPRLRQLEMAYSGLPFGWPMMIVMIINDYLLNLEIVLVLEMFADTGQEVIECGVQLYWGFPPRSKLTLRKGCHPAVGPQPQFSQNLLMLKLMWQFVLNRVWQIFRCMFMSGSNNREAASLPQQRDHKSLGWFVHLYW